MSVRSYRELEVWQKAMNLVVDCYKLASQFPKTEAYGLASQRLMQSLTRKLPNQ